MQQLTNIKESNRNPSLILLTAAPRERPLLQIKFTDTAYSGIAKTQSFEEEEN